MTKPDRGVRAQAADLAAVIERATGDLAIAEEPAGFQVALERGANDPVPRRLPTKRERFRHRANAGVVRRRDRLFEVVGPELLELAAERLELKAEYPRTLWKDLVNIKLILSERGEGGYPTVADNRVADACRRPRCAPPWAPHSCRRSTPIATCCTTLANSRARWSRLRDAAGCRRAISI